MSNYYDHLLHVNVCCVTICCTDGSVVKSITRRRPW